MNRKDKQAKIISSDPAKWLKGLAYEWANKRWGTNGVIALWLSFLVLAGAVTVWWNWDTLMTRPWVKGLLPIRNQDVLQEVDTSRFSILVANLEYDFGNDLKHNIIVSLREIRGLQVIALDTTIGTEDESGATERKKYLRAYGADVIISGSVIRNEGKSVPNLYWTVSPDIEAKQNRRYPLLPMDLRLPQLFWEDLSLVIQLLTIQQLEPLRLSKNQYIADRLLPLIRKVETILPRVTRTANGRASLSVFFFVLADAYNITGQQTGKLQALTQSIQYYRKSLRVLQRKDSRTSRIIRASILLNLGVAQGYLGEMSGDADELMKGSDALVKSSENFSMLGLPLQYAVAQHNLGNSLRILGSLQNEANFVRRAIKAHREALTILTLKDTPFYWGQAKSGLGVNLMTLGEMENKPHLLEEAVLEHREALAAFSFQQTPIMWNNVQTNLGTSLAAIGFRKKGTTELKEAASAFREALRALPSGYMPHQQAVINFNYGQTLAILSQRDSSSEFLCTAAECFLKVASYPLPQQMISSGLNSNELITAAKTALDDLATLAGTEERDACIRSLHASLIAILNKPIGDSLGTK